MVYAITYDLNKTGQNYEILYQKIRSLGETNHALQNLWLLKSSYSAITIRDELRKAIDNNDQVFITQIYKGSYSAWIDINVHKWLEERL